MDLLWREVDGAWKLFQQGRQACTGLTGSNSAALYYQIQLSFGKMAALHYPIIPDGMIIPSTQTASALKVWIELMGAKPYREGEHLEGNASQNGQSAKNASMLELSGWQ